MKRYVCTVAAGLLLALASTGTATANLIPIPAPPEADQTGTQSTSFGDQTVGEQTNDADVTQAQGNGNVNVSPAIAIFGDASTENHQGNDNTAVAVVDQDNTATQTQSSEQTQTQEQDAGGCCADGQSQTGTQSTDGGDQTVGEQKNDADVDQYQGNGNINVSPAIAIFGDAETTNYQGNDNTAVAVVDQSNEASQSQEATQEQTLEQDGTGCCDGQSQTGEQSAYFGDQTIEKQKNDAEVSQYQGNGNVNVSPAIAIGDGHSSCESKCDGWGLDGGDASTKNAQGNGNTAVAVVDQSNEANQSQSSEQTQSLEQNGGGCCEPTHDSCDSCDENGWNEQEACCDGGQNQTGEQHASFGDQTIEKQENDADVTQKQGNGNVNVSPAIAFGGDASTRNYQGNHNKAVALIGQSNTAEQSQSASQKQELSQEGGGCCEPRRECERPDPCEPEKDWSKHGDSCCDREHVCCGGRDQSGEQHASFGDQYVGKQKNDADVTQKQGNDNLNVSPALAYGGKRDRCDSRCGARWGGDASTKNAQGNGNKAVALLWQSNSAEQSQRSYQWQSLVQGGEVISL